MTIEFTKSPKSEDINFLSDKIIEETPDKGSAHSFGFFIRDDKDNIIAGCNGYVVFEEIYTDQLWVDKDHRHQGLGQQLMEKMHDYGRKNGCTMATVATMTFQNAKNFYEKLGYECDFERPGYVANSKCLFLKKDLNLPNFVDSKIIIRSMTDDEISMLVENFAAHNWPKPASVFEEYLADKNRFVWLAFYKNQFAGYVTLKFDSKYPYFRDQNIPEIMDLNVLPPFRNKGIGSKLLKTAEAEAAKNSQIVGIGVGLYQDYGAAQQLYIRKGYVPDGKGITYDYYNVIPGEAKPVDDDLILWFTKEL